MCVKYHGQWFSTALRMPEYTAFTICFRCMFCGQNCFIYCKILMVPCQNFNLLWSIIRKTNKIFDNIQQTLFLKHSFKKGIKLSILCIFIISIFCFPFHETIFPGSNCTCLRCQLITHNTNTIINKHRRNFMHIVTNLHICFWCIRFFSRRWFQFYKYNWHTI